jgi:2C-methyl-D-erythritol 2,4-cyclodiphosphate synthase
MRIGHGFDVHAFGGEGPIIIGGVRIPTKKDCWRILMATWRSMR